MSRIRRRTDVSIVWEMREIAAPRLYGACWTAWVRCTGRRWLAKTDGASLPCLERWDEVPAKPAASCGILGILCLGESTIRAAMAPLVLRRKPLIRHERRLQS